MQLQNTIAGSTEMAGIGIHSGEPVRLWLHSAAENHGIVFRRVDLPGTPEIPASSVALHEQPRRTSLKQGTAEVHTCEHLLAAARALGIDNLIVELDAAELPGCDGSARDFAEAMVRAGLSTQQAPRRTFALDRPCSVVQGERTIVALPCPDALRVTYVFAPFDGAFGGVTVFDFEVRPDAFLAEIAPARTFVTLTDAKLARAAGLGRGADYDNTLIWDGTQVLNNRLRFQDEPARHKILDVIGDMALSTRPLCAHIIAQRTGHRENLALLRQIEAHIDNQSL